MQANTQQTIATNPAAFAAMMNTNDQPQVVNVFRPKATGCGDENSSKYMPMNILYIHPAIK